VAKPSGHGQRPAAPNGFLPEIEDEDEFEDEDDERGILPGWKFCVSVVITLRALILYDVA
jgi:hypothetical protein